MEGSERARRAFVNAFERLVWQTVLARFGNMAREDQEEIVADTFIALLSDNARLLAQYSPTLGLSLPNYVRRQAIMQGYNRYRKLASQKRRAEIPLEPDGQGPQIEHRDRSPGPEERLTAKEDLEQRLDQLRRELSPTLLIAFELLYVRELTPAQAAATLGCSIDVIYQRKRRLLKAIKATVTENHSRGQP